MDKKNKKADMGIGTLIIFIAMILVAAIAAGVLIQTAGSLQSKALVTGERTRTQVSTSLTTTQIYGEDGTDGTLEYVYQFIKLAPGSDPIKFDDTLLTVDLTNSSANLNYKGTAGTCTASSANGFKTNTVGLGNWSAEYLVLSDEHKDGYLVRGDIAKVCFEAPRPVVEDEIIKVHLVPKVGSPSNIDLVTPEVMKSKRVFLFP
jgi:flagellin-like protein